MKEKDKYEYRLVKIPPHFGFRCNKCGGFFNTRFSLAYALPAPQFNYVCDGCYADIVNETPF